MDIKQIWVEGNQVAACSRVDLKHTRLIVFRAIQSLIDYIEPNKGLNEDQIRESVDWILEDFKMIKLEEVLFCLTDMKKNGRYFERLKYPEIKSRIEEFINSESRIRMIEEYNVRMKPESAIGDDIRGVDYIAYMKKIEARRSEENAKNQKVSLTQLEALKKFEENICLLHGVDLETVKSKTQKREYVDVRQMIQFFQATRLKWDHGRIAEYWGMERTTMNNSIQRVKERGFESEIIKAETI